jgi:hypothetical protein
LVDLLPGHGRVFCKSNSGNQGRGAFAAWATPVGLAGHCFDGRPLSGTEAVESAWRQLLAQGTALIQPCLENHPVLAPLAYNDEAITVRFISRWDTDPSGGPPSLHCLSATLEIPAGTGAHGRTFYAILPIRPESGALGPPILSTQPDPDVRDALRRVHAAAQAVPALPDWARLVDESYRAHRGFPDVYAIAWDWVLTPSGPVLLEGNGGWGTATVQLLQGGLLACAATGTPG